LRTFGDDWRSLSRKPEHFAGIDPVRILDDVSIQPIDLRPKERITEVQLRQIPQRIATLDGMRARLCFLCV
jgi:hypothetical protein